MWWLVCYEFFGFEFCCKTWVLLWVWLGFFFYYKFFGFEFCGKIWVLLLWLWLGLGMGKIGVDLRLESDISEEWSERGRGTREKRLERDRE